MDTVCFGMQKSTAWCPQRMSGDFRKTFSPHCCLPVMMPGSSWLLPTYRLRCALALSGAFLSCSLCLHISAFTRRDVMRWYGDQIYFGSKAFIWSLQAKLFCPNFQQCWCVDVVAVRMVKRWLGVDDRHAQGVKIMLLPICSNCTYS